MFYNVAAALSALGQDVNSVVATLNDQHITGTPEDNICCPVACYLMQMFPDSHKVSVDNEHITVSFGQFDRTEVEVTTPAAISAFVDLFDNEEMRTIREDLTSLIDADYAEENRAYSTDDDDDVN